MTKSDTQIDTQSLKVSRDELNFEYVTVRDKQDETGDLGLREFRPDAKFW